jgi:hypothetical protein
MSVYESNTQSFIIKIWTEDAANRHGRVVWRGQITHVASGERRYLTDLDQITAFVSKFLREMGVEPGRLGCVRRWLSGTKRKAGL